MDMRIFLYIFVIAFLVYEIGPITLTADSTAAIALALHLYYNGVHDEEDTKITIQPHRTQWNNKMYGMNNLHR